MLQAIVHNKKAFPTTTITNICRHVHQIAQDGFSDKQSELYEKARPSYPSTTIGHIKNLIQSSSGASGSNKIKVLELGAGTGKFTKSFFQDEASPSSSSQAFDYTATEPSDGFRAILENSAPKGVNSVIYATGNSIEVADKSLDAVIVAQAFHWMATEDTLQEVHRVLKPGGVFIMVWNVLDLSIPWIHVLEIDILSKYYDDVKTPRYVTGAWEDVYSSDVAKRIFSPVNKWTNPANAISKVTSSFIVDRMQSVSVVATKSAQEKAQIALQIGHLLKIHPDLADVKDGEYLLEYRSDVAFCVAK